MKVLIISHLPISNMTNMGKTFLSLFSFFDKNELCNFYIYPTIPNLDACSSYFRMTDEEILKSYVKRRNIGKIVTYDSTSKLFENEKNEKLYRNPKNKKAVRCIFRDLMWKFSNWYVKKLKNWINIEKPNLIFLAPGNQKFIYEIAIKISKKYDLPIVTYICDDYYFMNSGKTFASIVYHNLLKREIEKTLKMSKFFIGISQEISNSYEKEFDIKSYTIMTGTNYCISNEIHNYKNAKKINYFGNIRCNRYLSIFDIGLALDEINKTLKTKYELHLYISEKDENILKKLKSCSSIVIHDYLYGPKFKETFFKSEILLHVEAFDTESIDRVKYSVSTKISDSLASGIPLFAYGPSVVSSINHLIRNECAYVCVDKTKLVDSLKDFFNNYDLRNHYSLNGLNTAKKYHDSQKNSKFIYKILQDMTSKEGEKNENSSN